MKKLLQDKKIAIVYDWFDKWGGVERVLLTLAEMFPAADWFTSHFDYKKAPWAENLKLKTSFIQKLPKFIRGRRIVSLPFYPFAFESLDLSGYGLVISVTSSFAKGVVTRPETAHVCYMLTPARFLWTHEREYIENNILRRITSPFVRYLRQWDLAAAHRPDHLIAISKTVQRRIKKFYRRDSEVIYPPFDTSHWKALNKGPSFQRTDLNPPYYLLVSRLEPYKRVDLVVQAFNRLPSKHLVIAGKGSQLNALLQKAGKNITFLHDLTDEELAVLYHNAQALIMPQEEDFGLAALEAQFFGCPVIAYKAGGATETVLEGKTGIFFDEQTVQSLTAALAKFGTRAYNLQKKTRKYGSRHAAQFSREKFENKFTTKINEILGKPE